MTIRIRNDSTSAVVRGYAVDSHNTLVWLELAPQHPKTIGAIWADLVVQLRPWLQLSDFDVVGTGHLRPRRRGRTGPHDRFLLRKPSCASDAGSTVVKCRQLKLNSNSSTSLHRSKGRSNPPLDTLF